MQANPHHPEALYHKVFALTGMRQLEAAYEWCKFAHHFFFYERPLGRVTESHYNHWFDYQHLESYLNMFVRDSLIPDNPPLQPEQALFLKDLARLWFRPPESPKTGEVRLETPEFTITINPSGGNLRTAAIYRLKREPAEYWRDIASWGVRVEEGVITALACASEYMPSVTILPESIGHLTALRVLKLRYGGLMTLPDDIKQLQSLDILDLRTNKIATFPTPVTQLKSLRVLRLAGNKISRLPESIGRLTSLEYLNLAGNQLTELPTSIGRLRSLKHLALTKNQLTALPNSIGQLTALEKLDLYGNQLSTLPNSLGNLKSLRELRLGSNRLTALPASLGQLATLEELWLGENPWTDEWKTVVTQDIPTILTFCRNKAVKE